MDQAEQRAAWVGGTAIAVITVIALVGAAIAAFSTDNSHSPIIGPTGESAAAALRSFDGCDALLDELQDTAVDQYVVTREDEVFTDVGRAIEGDAPLAGPPAGVDAASDAATPLPATGGPAQDAEGAPGAWGGTNVQEAGVDEPDVWKTDGEVLLAVNGGTLEAIDISSDPPSSLGRLDLPTGGGQLLVDGDVALVLGDTGYLPMEDGRPSTTSASIVAIDVRDPAAMSVIGESRLEGYLVSARLVDGMARIVTTSTPTVMYDLPVRTPARMEDAIRETTIDTWLPRYEVTDDAGVTVDEGNLVGCEDVFVSEQPVDASMVNVVSLDLRTDELRPVDSASVVGAGSIVYASTQNVYVASPTYDPEDGTARTEIHQFATIGREPAEYVASGRVEGELLNQFSMSDHEGHLRVAVTTSGFDSVMVEPMPAPEPFEGGDVVSRPVAPPMPVSESSVVVLGAGDGVLREVGRVDGLGRGERIYSVRFMGDVGYVVTFRQTDPLYTLDLSDPTHPQQIGELKIPGYSSYLHPVGDGLLLGIGQDANELGRVQGFQIALFDVSDLAVPQQLQKLALPDAYSMAEHDHHAFTWWAERGLALVPVANYETLSGAAALEAFTVDPSGIASAGTITHPDWCRDTAGYDCSLQYAPMGIYRSMVVDGRILSLSGAGVMVSSGESLGEIGWVAFE